MSGVVVEARNLAVRYSELVALSIDSFSLEGSVIALLGHNGAGKSTFIKSVLGLLEPVTGALTVHTPSGELLIPERHMAFCPETGAVFADIAVERYFQLWCRIKHGDARYYRRTGAPYLERLSISELLHLKGRELSKGQRRRVQTALGFMADPRLFLFDEPFDGLDVQRTSDLMEIVEAERQHRAFLISSHRMDVIEKLADKVVVLQQGQVACAGSVRDVCQVLTDSDSGGQPVSLIDAMRTHLQHLRASGQGEAAIS
jgi:ABC-2 type transport system ATP-binding protein